MKAPGARKPTHQYGQDMDPFWAPAADQVPAPSDTGFMHGPLPELPEKWEDET